MQTVGDLLNRKGRDVWFISPDATVHEAAALMEERNVGAVLVCKDGQILGILSERDCVRRVMLQRRSPASTRVREVMTTPIQSVTLHETVDHCMQQMTDRRVRHLPVVEGGQLLGMISMGDVMKAELSEQEDLISGLESYIHGPSASARPPAS
jgi:CBS domain-containing protein